MELIHEEDGFEVWWGPKDLQVSKETKYGDISWYVHMPFMKPRKYTTEEAMANYKSARRKIEAAEKSLDELKTKLIEHIAEFAEPMRKVIDERRKLRQQRKTLKKTLDAAAQPHAYIVARIKEQNDTMSNAEREALTAERAALKEKLDAVKKPYDAFMHTMRDRLWELDRIEEKILRKMRYYGKWKNQQGLDTYCMERALKTIIEELTTTSTQEQYSPNSRLE